MLTPEQRTLRARAAAHAQWGRTPDRTERTRPKRESFYRRFEREVEREFPNATPEAKAKMVESRRRSYFTRLALLSAKARRARKGKAA